jgi:hypothetical protein
MNTELKALFSTDCCLLDLGERRGWTSYIDFIRPDELADEHTMKGTDALGRQFIVFKCTVSTVPPRRLFTTFFQRYKSDEALHHTAGHYGTHLFTTTGGASLEQVEHMCRLLRTGRIDLNVEKMMQMRVGYRDHMDIERLDPLTIDTVTLGWSTSPLF